MFRAIQRLHIYRLLHKITVAFWSSRQLENHQLAEEWNIRMSHTLLEPGKIRYFNNSREYHNL